MAQLAALPGGAHIKVLTGVHEGCKGVIIGRSHLKGTLTSYRVLVRLADGGGERDVNLPPEAVQWVPQGG
jgi:hypothetical protein